MKTPAHASKTPDDTVPSVQDGRQSETALEIQSGVFRLLTQHALACVAELSLPNHRRADIAGVSERGEIWMIEIKSSLADFQCDQKWPEYQDFCDRFYFAVKPDFPHDVLPHDQGLILADNYGGEIVREAETKPLSPARRKTMLLRIARTAAHRVTALTEPGLRHELWQRSLDG